MPFLSPKNIETFLLISVGSVFGANLRYWLGAWIAERWSGQFPIHTMLINLTGSLVMGFFTALASERLPIDSRWRLFFAIGFLGSYTTFSTYTFEGVSLFMEGNWPHGLLILAGSMLLGGLAAGVGLLLGRLV